MLQQFFTTGLPQHFFIFLMETRGEDIPSSDDTNPPVPPILPFYLSRIISDLEQALDLTGNNLTQDYEKIASDLQTIIEAMKVDDITGRRLDELKKLQDSGETVGIIGALFTVGSIGLILFTAGLATPLIAVAGASGTATAYGANQFKTSGDDINQLRTKVSSLMSESELLLSQLNDSPSPPKAKRILAKLIDKFEKIKNLLEGNS
jgi:hypothetical protein